MENLPGGLSIRKDRDRQSRPSSGSTLGLDRLAAEKAKERSAAEASKPMAPPPKRPYPGDADGSRQYRRPREETPSHAGGVNEVAAARIAARVKDRLKGDGQTFTAGDRRREGGGAAAHSRADPSPAPSEWEAPSPAHPPLVPDRAAFGSEARGFLVETPMGPGASSSLHAGSSAPTHVSATPQPSPYMGPPSRGASGATPAHPGAAGGPRDGPGGGGNYKLGGLGGSGGGGGGGGGGGEWEQESTVGDDAAADAADTELDRAWYDQDEGGHAVRGAHLPGRRARFTTRTARTLNSYALERVRSTRRTRRFSATRNSSRSASRC